MAGNDGSRSFRGHAAAGLAKGLYRHSTALRESGKTSRSNFSRRFAKQASTWFAQRILLPHRALLLAIPVAFLLEAAPLISSRKNGWHFPLPRIFLGVYSFRASPFGHLLPVPPDSA